MKTIEIRVASSQEAVLNHQCDIVENHFDTIKEAKEKAKYYVSGDYEKYLGDDASEPMRYAQVWVNDELVQDYFKKETE